MTNTVHIRGNKGLKEVSGQDKEKEKDVIVLLNAGVINMMLIKEAEEV